MYKWKIHKGVTGRDDKFILNLKFILCGFADLKSNWDENNIYLVISVYELVITTQFNFIWSNSQCSFVSKEEEMMFAKNKLI